jgi:hypothetical protein
MLKRMFLDHPSSLGETYFEHQKHAMSFAASMFFGAAACFLHGLIPAACKTTGSRTVIRLHERMTIARKLKGTEEFTI